MAVITEMGFSISHEFEGGKAVKSLKRTTVKSWEGEGSSTCASKSTDSGCYQDVTIQGKTYSNAKIIESSNEYEDGQAFSLYTIEQKISADCTVFLGFKSEELDSYSDNISTSKTSDQVSVSRTVSLAFSDASGCSGSGGTVSSPKGGDGLIDRAVNAIKGAMAGGISFSSSDSDINGLIGDIGGCDKTGKTKSSKTESIDRAGCAVTLAETHTRELGADDCCITSDTISISIDDSGMTSVSVSGNINGNCEEIDCTAREVTKSKYDYAKDCFDDIDIDSLLLDEYTKHKQEPCEEDVCLAFVKNSESTTHCKEDGTISYSASAAEEEVLESDGVFSLVTEESTKNGCITEMTRTFEIEAPVNQKFIEENPAYLDGDCSDALPSDTEEAAIEKARTAFGNVDLDAPADFFGPLSFNMTECQSKGTINGTASYSDDPVYGIEFDGVIKKLVTTTNTCSESAEDRRFAIPCSSAITQKVNKKPGSTSACKDVEAFYCATLDEILDEIEIDVPADAVVVAKTSNVSVQTGAKTANRCVTYHTKEDLKECT